MSESNMIRSNQKWKRHVNVVQMHRPEQFIDGRHVYQLLHAYKQCQMWLSHFYIWFDQKEIVYAKTWPTFRWKKNESESTFQNWWNPEEIQIRVNSSIKWEGKKGETFQTEKNRLDFIYNVIKTDDFHYTLINPKEKNPSKFNVTVGKSEEHQQPIPLPFNLFVVSRRTLLKQP